jgi:hypothetical protein
MNDRLKSTELLDDVLAEGAPPALRAALLEQSLRIASRRRRWRQSRRWAGAASVLLLAAWLAAHSWTPRPAAARPPSKRPAPNLCRFVETQPLALGAVVMTRPMAAAAVISSRASVAEIATRTDEFCYINDAQLLALVGREPAILIRTGPNSEELVFADAKSSPGN